MCCMNGFVYVLFFSEIRAEKKLMILYENMMINKFKSQCPVSQPLLHTLVQPCASSGMLV